MNIENLKKIETSELLNYENEFYGSISEGLAMLVDGDETVKGMEESIQSTIESLLTKQMQLIGQKTKEINIDSIFSNILSFHVPDGNPELFKEKIEQYYSEMSSL